MDLATKFPGRLSCQAIHSDITKRLALRSLNCRKQWNFHSDKMKIQHFVSIERKVRIEHRDNKKISLMATYSDTKYVPDSSLSPSDLVEQFYTCINDKKLRQLDECISKDAHFEDYSFTKPFQGKREVMQFLEQLTACMGQNVKFRVGYICKGDDFTAAANWHLEWKKVQIPFTRGSSFFKCSKEGEKLRIRKAEVLIESPIKPGSIVLTLFKTIASLFDDFPKATEWFLRSPHTILKWITSIYSILITPFLNPLLDGYIKLWSFMARLLGYTFSIVIFISKIFFK
ncbi:hypothetical protein L6164_019431 [Bauhinia variegata]|uniref:Uncharacterized protein n=1 Tax=Bauhinia variegata TaxID=167791 RepID=A0ACB9MTD4_BAUVA|nr:hypothetical protein L6164_019431 [Bauhinia variegata]